METVEKTENKTNIVAIVSKKDEIEALNVKRQKMVDFLTERIEQREAELQNKKYILEGKAEFAAQLLDFVKFEAKWKFSEALGVLESVKQLEEAIKSLRSKKTTELMLPSLVIEAVYYFLTKVEGTGIVQAQKYVDMLKPISDALGRSKQDRTDLDQLIRDQGSIESAIESGASLENEDALLKEIQAEMEMEMEHAASVATKK